MRLLCLVISTFFLCSSSILRADCPLNIAGYEKYIYSGFSDQIYWDRQLSSSPSSNGILNLENWKSVVGKVVSCDVYQDDPPMVIGNKMYINIWDVSRNIEITTLELSNDGKIWACGGSENSSSILKKNYKLICSGIKMEFPKNIPDHRIAIFGENTDDTIALLKAGLQDYFSKFRQNSRGRIHLFIGPFSSTSKEIRIFFFEKKEILFLNYFNIRTMNENFHDGLLTQMKIDDLSDMGQISKSIQSDEHRFLVDDEKKQNRFDLEISNCIRDGILVEIETGK
jgi:hypothetical protein